MKTALLHLLCRNWGWILLRGILAIIFGVMAFAWPLLTLHLLVLFYGAYALADGFVALMAAIMGGTPAPRWWLALIGLLGIAVGVIIFVHPTLSALTLILFMGYVAIVRGVFEIVGAISLRKEISNEWLLILGGVLSVIFGISVVMFPGAGALALIWIIATYAIVIGLLLVGLALRLRRHGHSHGAS
jgi:uncharacterized membrane protein HdeD (DUF308 family)